MQTPIAEALDLLLDLPELRATLDALPGYTFPTPARAALCWQHRLSEETFAAVVKAHGRLRGRVSGRRSRDGWDLLLELPDLREMLDRERDMPVLGAATLARRRELFRLTAPELVNVLQAHAEAWSRA